MAHLLTEHRATQVTTCPTATPIIEFTGRAVEARSKYVEAVITRAAHFEPRHYKVYQGCAGAPRGLHHFKCEQVTKACKCLSIPTPRTTKTITRTVTPTKTSTSVSTRTVTVTLTRTQTVNTFAVTTFTPTTTTTSVQTSTVSSCPCAAPSGICNGQCLNLDTDPNNCGSCGNVCDSGTCRNGLCLSPSCAGQTCDTFTACGPGGSCVCASVAGGGLCADGQTPCAGLADCTVDSDCPTGRLCALNTCCTRGVCIASNNECENGGSPLLLFAKRKRVSGPTIGGR